MKQLDVKKLTSMAVFAAVAYVAMFVTHLIPPVSGFLSFDAKDAVIVLSGMVFSPAAAVIITLVVSFIEMITIGHTGFIGLIMNFISTTAFLLPVCIIYRRKRSSKSVIYGLLTSTLVATGIMLLWNLFLTPIYMSVPQSAVLDMMLPILLPFNLIKYIMNSAIVLLLYRKVLSALGKIGVADDKNNTKTSVADIAIALGFAVVAAVVCYLMFYVK